MIVLICALSIVRPTWAFLLFPVVTIYHTGAPSSKKSLNYFIIISSLFAPLLFFYIWRLISAPLAPGYSPFTWITSELTYPLHWSGFRNIGLRLNEFSNRLVDYSKIKNLLLDYAMVWQSICLFVVCLINFLSSAVRDGFRKNMSWLFLIIWILGLNLFNAIYVYGVDASAQARLLLVPFLMSIVFIIGFCKKWPVIFVSGIIFSNLLVVYFYAPQMIESIAAVFPVHTERLNRLGREFAAAIPFDQNKDP